MVTRWWWVRHAPVALTADLIYGQTDLTCDCSNRAALTAIAARLPVQAVVVCSPLSRTRRTLEALMTAGWMASAASEPLIEADFMEQAFGAWEGAEWCQLSKTDPQYAIFWDSPFTIRPPGGGESFVDVIERVKGAVLRLSRKYTGYNIVVFAHAGSIRAALAIALDLTPDQVHTVAVDPLSITCLEHLGATWRVQGVNRL